MRERVAAEFLPEARAPAAANHSSLNVSESGRPIGGIWMQLEITELPVVGNKTCATSYLLKSMLFLFVSVCFADVSTILVSSRFLATVVFFLLDLSDGNCFAHFFYSIPSANST